MVPWAVDKVKAAEEAGWRVDRGKGTEEIRSRLKGEIGNEEGEGVVEGVWGMSTKTETDWYTDKPAEARR